MDLAPGQRVGNYVAEARLGGGGMATVWKVRHAGLGTIHALKVLSPELLVHEDVRRRFLDEGRIQATLQHPNIVAVTDLVAEPGIAGLVMEYVEGRTLDEVLKAGPMAPERAVEIMRQVLGAVGAAHAKGVVHRDLKPSNLILTTTGVVKVLDFGIAKLTGDAKGATKTGTRLGTLLYMSPEQVRGSKELDARSDIWSLGVVLYELVTGQMPFDGADDLESMMAIAAGRFIPASERNRKVSRSLDDVIAKALIVPANGRHASCAAFDSALVAALRPPAVLPPVARPVQPPVAVVPSVAPRDDGDVKSTLTPRAKFGVFVGFSVLALAVVSFWPHAPVQPAAASSGSCPAGMVYIAGGTFDMGSNDGYGDEKPVHRVTVSAFCIDKFERHDANDMPLVSVSWDEAVEACKRDGNRLPTEAEWEFAARGTQGRKYPWGNSEPSCDKANYFGCGDSAKRVGSASAGATPEGVQDLAGNVWEWVADCYGSYPSGPQNNPGIGQNACQGFRVNRGGGYNSDASNVRASNRNWHDPRDRYDHLGFRCARGTSR